MLPTALRLAGILRPPQQKMFKGLAPFLLALKSNGKAHGTLFRYLSPNSDLLGLVLERAMGQRYASLLSHHIWQPLGCAHDAYVTVDAEGTARSAGGICVHPHDLVRLGLALIEVDSERSENVMPHRWIHDTFNEGNQAAWQQGEFSALLPDGNYRNQWYRTQARGGALIGNWYPWAVALCRPVKSSCHRETVFSTAARK